MMVTGNINVMRFVGKFYFAYFWFSHRPGGGEANA